MKYIGKFVKKQGYTLLIIILAACGIYQGIKGFHLLNPAYSNGFQNGYETARMFLLNTQLEPGNMNCHLYWASWLTLAAFLLFSGRIFVRLLSPRLYRWCYFKFYCKGHIIICGLNELAMNLIKRYEGRKLIVVTANKNNSFLEGLNRRNIMVIVGNPNDEEVLRQIRLEAAAQVYVVKKDDRMNVEIAHKIYQELKKKQRHSVNPLKCFVMVQDIELKMVLQESHLFKEGGKNDLQEKLTWLYWLTLTLLGKERKPKIVFDGILFNIAEAGIHYALNKQISTIFGGKINHTPRFLIIGLNGDAEEVILDLAHGLTREKNKIHFTVIEKEKYIAECFQARHPYLKDFVEIEYKFLQKEYCDAPGEALELVRNVIPGFTAIFICFNNGIDNIKAAFAFSRIVKMKHPAVITFCNHPESLSEVMGISTEGKNNVLQVHNIHIINTFDETFDYIFELDKKIEECAEAAHNMWNKKYNGISVYNELTEHFKQSNRNQVIDNYYKMYLLGGQHILNCNEPVKQPEVSESIREIMAEMEHRRWMIEKFRQGWRYGIHRDNNYQIHPDLLDWKILTAEAAQKDRDFVTFMLSTLDKNFKNE